MQVIVIVGSALYVNSTGSLATLLQMGNTLHGRSCSVDTGHSECVQGLFVFVVDGDDDAIDSCYRDGIDALLCLNLWTESKLLMPAIMWVARRGASCTGARLIGPQPAIHHGKLGNPPPSGHKFHFSKEQSLTGKLYYRIPYSKIIRI